MTKIHCNAKGGRKGGQKEMLMRGVIMYVNVKRFYLLQGKTITFAVLELHCSILEHPFLF